MIIFLTLLLHVTSVVTIRHLREAADQYIYGVNHSIYEQTDTQITILYSTHLGVELRYEVVLFIITWAFEFEVILFQQLLILCLLRLGSFTFCIHQDIKAKKPRH